MVVKLMEHISASKLNNFENKQGMSGEEVQNICNTEQDNQIIPVFRTRSSQRQLQQLLSLQLDLIEHQQLKIVRKDKQIVTLRTEKEQLEARLNRMERRLAVHKRNNLDNEDVKIARSLSRTSMSSDKNKLTQVTPVTVTSKTSQSLDYNGCLHTDFSYLDYDNYSLARRKHSEENIKQTSIDVSVPPWKVVVHDKTIDVEDVTEEDVRDEAFEKRHSKPEIEEKRRKRWDLQQLRQQQQHEVLVQKYNERENRVLSTKCVNDSSKNMMNSDFSLAITTLFKSEDNILAINVSEMVPICAFGYPLPALETTEMNLPWFDVAKRENQLRNSKLKSSKKSKQK